ncbi:hypothetical protein ACFL0L_00445 [Patescibacteria group bacterium]
MDQDSSLQNDLKPDNKNKVTTMRVTIVLLILGLFLFSIGSIFVGFLQMGFSDSSRSSSPDWVVYVVVIGIASVVGLIVFLSFKVSSKETKIRKGFSWRRLIGPLATLLFIIALPFLAYVILGLIINAN